MMLSPYDILGVPAIIMPVTRQSRPRFIELQRRATRTFMRPHPTAEQLASQAVAAYHFLKNPWT